ncbi:hypothetical protein WJX74_001220 [Apatococcus lobatus]|uniref:DUF7897 domain-containing protein n=1 Tax=Apatococcus lobatus TaxID=904363 RepID=A0AAW1RD96_9CHLO
MDVEKLWQEFGAQQALSGHQRVDLLKATEALTRTIYKESSAFQDGRHSLGTSASQVQQVESAVLDQNWTGIPEYSKRFYKVFGVSSARQHLQRAFIRLALDHLEHGFDGFDASLIYHASHVSDAYDPFYVKWAHTMQGNDLAKRLQADDKAGKVPKPLYNHYTAITSDDGHNYSQVANATFFEEIAAIVTCFDSWISDLEKQEGPTEKLKANYLAYLKQYRACLAETDVEQLEPQWHRLDELWMSVRHHIQVVHDIEYGYGDPLRTKVAPEFSLRLLDESYAADNAQIGKIQDLMVDYFKTRTSDLARGGLNALRLSMAGLYYLPFQAGISLFFRFSGQSIPNRSEVRNAHGVKIYFDPVSMAARQVTAKKLAASVLEEPARQDCIDTIGTLVYHVAAHEIGHAIYGLDAMKDAIKVTTRTLLEEPRAELTALHTMCLMVKADMVSEAQMQQHLASFMLCDLRRFAMWDSQATRPYALSAATNWSKAHDLGYITLTSAKKMTFDDSKAQAFITSCSKDYEDILDAEDGRDGATIEATLHRMEQAEWTPVVQHLLEQLWEKD